MLQQLAQILSCKIPVFLGGVGFVRLEEYFSKFCKVLSQEEKHMAMQRDLEEFHFSEKCVKPARSRAFYGALEKILLQCSLESVESRRATQVNAAYKWFLKSRPHQTHKVCSSQKNF